MPGIGGILVLKTSGKSKRTSRIGNEFRNSAWRISVEKLFTLPPITCNVPVFCSGIFQKIFLSIRLSVFVQ